MSDGHIITVFAILLCYYSIPFTRNRDDVCDSLSRSTNYWPIYLIKTLIQSIQIVQKNLPCVNQYFFVEFKRLHLHANSFIHT